MPKSCTGGFNLAAAAASGLLATAAAAANDTMFVQRRRRGQRGGGDDQPPVVEIAGGAKRRPGRPRKVHGGTHADAVSASALTEGIGASESASAITHEEIGGNLTFMMSDKPMEGGKRGRGRPRKSKGGSTTHADAVTTDAVTGGVAASESSTAAGGLENNLTFMMKEGGKRGRGRPRKVKPHSRSHSRSPSPKRGGAEESNLNFMMRGGKRCHKHKKGAGPPGDGSVPPVPPQEPIVAPAQVPASAPVLGGGKKSRSSGHKSGGAEQAYESQLAELKKALDAVQRF